MGAPRASLMDRSGEEFLAGAGVAAKEHGGLWTARARRARRRGVRPGSTVLPVRSYRSRPRDLFSYLVAAHWRGGLAGSLSGRSAREPLDGHLNWPVRLARLKEVVERPHRHVARARVVSSTPVLEVADLVDRDPGQHGWIPGLDLARLYLQASLELMTGQVGKSLEPRDQRRGLDLFRMCLALRRHMPVGLPHAEGAGVAPQIRGRAEAGLGSRLAVRHALEDQPERSLLCGAER